MFHLQYENHLIGNRKSNLFANFSILFSAFTGKGENFFK